MTSVSILRFGLLILTVLISVCCSPRTRAEQTGGSHFSHFATLLRYVSRSWRANGGVRCGCKLDKQNTEQVKESCRVALALNVFKETVNTLAAGLVPL